MGLNEPVSETIGERLRRLRLERGVSQRALAQKGVSYAYISRIEAGTRTPSVKALRLLAQQLGVSVDYLETGSDLGAAESRELRLRDAELRLHLGDDAAATEQILRQLVTESDGAGDLPASHRARAALGLLAQRRGDHTAVVAELEPVVESGAVSVVESWSLYATLGRSYAALGRSDDTVALFRSCLAELDDVAPTNDIAYVRTAALLSAALSDAGELAAARETVASALRRAGGTGDPLTRVRLYWSYARIALNEQKPRVALENLRRAVALLEATEDTRELGRAHLFWAEILTFDNRPDEAEVHLELADRLLGDRADQDDLALLRTEQARAAAELGRGAEAIGLAEAALELIGEGDRSDRATALWALGVARNATGDSDGAITALSQALDLFEESNDWYEAATVARRLGTTLRALGREADALDVLERAVELSTRADTRARSRSALRS